MKGTWYSSARLSYYGGYQRHRPDSSIQSRQNLPFRKGLIEYHTALCRNPSLHCSKDPYSLSFRCLPCRLFQSPCTNESFLYVFCSATIAILDSHQVVCRDWFFFAISVKSKSSSRDWG